MQQTELLPEQFTGKVKFKGKQVQGNQHFETDAEVGKPGSGIVFTKYCIFYQKSFHLPFSFLKRWRGIGGFEGKKLFSDKL